MNESYEQVLFSESKTDSCRQFSPIPEQINLLNLLFFVNKVPF